MAPIKSERGTGDERDAAADGALEQLVGVGAVDEANPREQSAAHGSDRDALAEAVGQRLDQRVCALAIQPANER